MHGADTTSARLITSSALSALLPVAAAEGIVRPNFQAPRLSFYSPSGTLIEENANTQLPRFQSLGKSSSKRKASTLISGRSGTSRAYDVLAAAAHGHSATPALAAVATPPQLSAPLPYHLRKHHDYQQVEPLPSIDDCDAQSHLPTHIRGYPAINGRKTMMDDTRMKCRSHTTVSAEDTQFGCAFSPVSGSEASRSRSHQFPIWRPSQKGKTLQESQSDHRAGSGLSLVAGYGYAMRVCFCQPYDGVGAKSNEAVVYDDLDDQCRNEIPRRAACESYSPNARIVQAAGQRSGNQAKGSRTPRRRDSVTSTGVAVRVGMLGCNGHC